MTTISRRRPVHHHTTTTPVATTNTLNTNKEEQAMKFTNNVTKTANSLKGVTRNSTKIVNNEKEAATMTTIKLTVDLNTLTKAQKAALTTLGVSYKKPVEKKEPVKKSAPKKVSPKKAAPVVKDRMTIRSTSTDALVAYNLCMLRKGQKLYDIDTACKAAKAKGAKASTLMFKKHGNGMDFTAWVKRNVAFILKQNDIDIINACNGRQDLAESYIKAKG